MRDLEPVNNKEMSMTLEDLRHTPEAGRKTKADKKFWRAINTIWDNKKPCPKPDTSNLRSLAGGIGDQQFRIYYDDQEAYVVQFVNGIPTWYAYDPHDMPS